MEKPPQFIKEFSKEQSSTERQEASRAIKVKRAEHFAEKSARTERQLKIAEQLRAINRLTEEIAELSAGRLAKIKNYLQLRKLRADLALGQKTYDELKQELGATNTERESVVGADVEDASPHLEEARGMIKNFYNKQKEKWMKSEYTQDDITENFSEEHLASLSLEDYTLLLKRFPREMIAHVTRQGIRDHIGLFYHTAGAGAYANGFMKMAEDGRLRSPLGVYLVEEEKEKAIAKFLQLDRYKTQKEALAHLDSLVGGEQGGSGSYVDRMAVHFATEEVADVYYGSETGNEIFVIYPSAYIASQYYFNGKLNEGGGGYWNDQWVWANEERGMDLNAGIVFIPEEARVDRKTGSRYEIDKDGNPVKNSKSAEAIKKVVEAPDFLGFAEQIMEILRRTDDKKRQLLESFRDKLEQEFGITDMRLQMAILSYNCLLDLTIRVKSRANGETDPRHSIDSGIGDVLSQAGIFYNEASDPINSKDFWEAYFTKNPNKRPSKIVYYRGTDPSQAFWQWRREQGIDKKAKDKDIGFSDRHVDRDAPEATAGLERFRTLATKVIEDRFSERETMAA